eukprot:11282185-Ditylum_brightwellii.AAC.1
MANSDMMPSLAVNSSLSFLDTSAMRSNRLILETDSNHDVIVRSDLSMSSSFLGAAKAECGSSSTASLNSAIRSRRID